MDAFKGPEFVRITIFDDGRESMADHKNEWVITAKMFGGGKLALRNSADNTVTIESISAWKTTPV